jgi:hypothetical protein
MNPTKLFQVHYRRPQGAPPGTQPAAPPATPPAPPTAAIPVEQTQYQPAPPPVYATNGTNGTGHYAPPAAPPPPAPAAPPPPLAMSVDNLSPEQQQLLAQLTGAARQ